MVEAAPSSVSGFRAPGGRGLASTFSTSPVSFRRATETYKAGTFASPWTAQIE